MTKSDIPSNILNMIERLIGREGGYVNHPSDRGGATIWGITEAVARRFGYSGPMRGMSRDIAFEIYLAQYWIMPGFDQVAKYSLRIAEELFDFAVNSGPARASICFQEALNGLNMQQKLYKDIVEDGDIGPATLKAFASYLQARRKEPDHIEVFELAIKSLRGAFFLTISRNRQKNEDFTYGWFRRLLEV